MQSKRPGGVGCQRWAGLVLAVVIGAASGLGWAAAADSSNASLPPLRYSAPVVVNQPAPFVALPLPVSVYARSLQPGLADLRMQDGAGQRVPFALLSPREDVQQSREQLQPVALYPLPPGPVGAGVPASLELTVQGDRISLRQRGAAGAAGAAGVAGGTSATTALPPAGWLFDLGDTSRPSSQGAAATALAPPHRLRLRWSGPAEFSAGFSIDTSEDLRQWRRGSSGQLMALSAPAGSSGAASLTQPLVMLDGTAARFVRLVWHSPAQAPRITGADAVTDNPEAVQRDASTELRLTAMAATGKDGDPAAPGALLLDLGGVLPLRSLDLALPAGTRVLPLRVQQRLSDKDPWREAALGVIYRIERDGGVHRSPPLALNTQARYLRLLPDERGPGLDAAATPVVLQAQLAKLVFANQGTPPYRLLVGAPPGNATTPGAMPIGTLVPLLDQERERFGKAELGAFTEQAEVAQQVARDEAMAAWRPRLLWAVLLLGVAGLGWMVWRLARQPAAASNKS